MNRANPFFQFLLKVFSILTAFFFIACIYWVFTFSSNYPNNDTEFLEEFTSKYNVYSIPLPEKIDFASENVPLNLFDVRESLDRELHVNAYWQSQTILFFKRANRYFPIIEPILKKNGIPDDFKYLAVIESGLTNTVSPSGARGIWQFIKETGKLYGLEISDEVDERYNLEKATEAACKYFKESYAEYKNWTLVAASYNMGIAGLTKSLNSQKVDNYYDLLLNEETARYVYRILAVKLIMMNPETYGFIFRKKDLYYNVPTEVVTIDSTVTDFANFAIQMKINYKILKIFNPWLRQNTLTNKDKKTYSIRIPKEGYREVTFSNKEFDEQYAPDSLNNASDSLKNALPAD